MSDVTLVYRCRRCSECFAVNIHGVPWEAKAELRARTAKTATIFAIHECNGDDSKHLGVADLIGANR